MSNIKKKWMDRVCAPEMSHGLILQMQTCIVPRASGYDRAGRRFSLDQDDCADIVEAFDNRVLWTGGPKVTDEQAEVGRRWLCSTGHRHGMPKINYHDIDHFTLVDFVTADKNSFRMIVGAVYHAHWPDGAVMRYAPMPWVNGGGVEWYWITKPEESAA